MTTLIQNRHTSLLPIYSQAISGEAIVLLSTTTNVGQLITVRDMEGALGQGGATAIRVSTTPGVTLDGGATPLLLQQGFAYVTLRAATPSAWVTLDRAAFLDPSADYSLRGIAYSSFLVTDQVILKSGVLTTGPISTQTVSLTSSLATGGQTSASTLGVGTGAAPTGIQRVAFAGGLVATYPFQTTDMLSTPSLTTMGPLTASNTMTVTGPVAIGGALTYGAATITGALSTSYSTTVAGTVAASGTTTLGSLRTTRSLAASTLSTTTTVATIAQATAQLAFSTAGTLVARTDIPINDPNYNGPTNPVLFTTLSHAAPALFAECLTTSSMTVGALAVTTAIQAPALQTVTFSSAAIQAPTGSLLTSSIQTGSFSGQLLGAPSAGPTLPAVTSGTLVASTIQGVSTAVQVAAQATAPTAATRGMTASTVATSTIGTGTTPFQVNTLAASTVTISTGFVSNELSSIYAPTATISAAQIRTSSLQTGGLALRNTLLRPQTITSPSGSTFTFSAPLTTISTAQVQQAVVQQSTFTSSFTGTAITLGQALSYSTIGPTDPWISTSTMAGMSTNTKYEYIQGIGTPYQPLQIRATNDRTVALYLQNASTFSTTYLNASFTYRSDPSAGTGTAGLRIVNPGGTSTLIAFQATSTTSFQSATLSNYPVDLNTAATTTSFWLAGANTLQAPSTQTQFPAIVAGGAGGPTTLALNTTGDGKTWTNVSCPITTQVNCVASDGTRWIAGGFSPTDSLAYSYNGTDWYGLGVSFFSGSCNGIAWNGTLWVAVGNGINSLAYSYNGLSWTGLGSSIFTTNALAVAWNGVVWVAVGYGTNTVAYSYDGINWTGLGGSVFSTYGLGIAYGGGLWVATGSGGVGGAGLAYSTDGINWTPTAVPDSDALRPVAYSGTAWLAGGIGIAYNSPDGINWTPVSITDLTQVLSICWTGSEWLIAGSAATNTFATSPDGINWTGNGGTTYFGAVAGVAPRRTFPIDVSGTDLLVGASTGSSDFAYSLTGSTWQGLAGSLFTRVNAVAYGFRQWVAVGTGTYSIAYSYDGVTWVGAATVAGGPFTEGHSVAWNGICWAAVGTASTDAVAYSFDGIAWTGVTGTTLATAFRVIAWNHAAFFAYGTGTNTIATSPDGITWTGQGAGTAPTECAAWNGSNLWVGGADVAQTGNTLLTSSNGLTWTGQGSATFNSIVRSVAWNGSNWIAVGGSNVGIATSANGTSWTPRPTDLSGGSAVTWTGKRWVVGGFHSPTTKNIATSADGISWSTFTAPQFVSSPVFANRTPLPYGAADSNVVFAADSNVLGRLYTTSDGISWRSTFVGGFGYNIQQFTTANWNGQFWMLGRASFAALDNLSTNFVASGPPISIWGMAILRGVAWGTNNVGIAVGQGNNYCLGMTTDGGNSWFSGAILSQTAPYYCMTEPINGATFGKNLFVITGNPNSAVYGAIKYSVNGSNWSTPTIPSGRGFAIGNGIAYHSSMFVAVGEGILGDRDGIGYSTDGSNWGWVSSIFSDGRGVCWGKDKWVAVGGGLHTIAYSLNGSNWTGLGTSIFTNIGRSVTWNGKYFIATGNGGNGLAYSSDGISWTGLGNSILSNGVFVSARLPSPVEIPPALSTSTFELKLFNWSLTGVTQITQQQVQKPVGGTSAWDARAASQESYSATATLSFQPAQTTAEIMMGLSETPSATTSYTALNYAFYMMSSGNLRIYELGVQVAIIGTYSTSDTLRITYDGTTVRYYQNSTLVRSVARALGPPLFLSSSFYTPGGAVQAVAFSPLAQLTTTQPTLSTTGYFVSQSSGSNTDQYGPFFQTLSTTINPGTWTFYATMDGTAVGSNSFYADIFLNGAKYFSTNTVTPVYATLSTYVFTAQIPSRIAISTTTVLDVRFRATRPTGNTFLYTNYTSADALSIRSSATILNTYNPNAIEYLQFYHTNSNTGLQTSELDISITQFSTQSTSYLQSNVGMDVYAGYLVWPSGLNGTTIENRYNDTVTRSLTYTGSLYTASDPRLKENIQLAPTATLYETMASLPLYRYRIREEHRATYRIDDTHQLGVLATDVAQRLQGATAVAESSGLLTVDSDQLFYTHLATTQHLQARISSLRARITRGF